MADGSPTLYLFPTPIWPGTSSTYLTDFHRKIIQQARVIAVENINRAASFLKSADKNLELGKIRFYHLQNTDIREISEFIKDMVAFGEGLILSDAGMPCIADPGALVVREAHKLNINVVPLPGPSSIFMALSASGLSGQKFRFMGYPTKNTNAISSFFLYLKKILKENPEETVIFMEAPQRNSSFFQHLLFHLPGDQRLCVACGLQGPNAWIKTHLISEWPAITPPFSDKMPCLFLIN